MNPPATSPTRPLAIALERQRGRRGQPTAWTARLGALRSAPQPTPALARADLMGRIARALSGPAEPALLPLPDGAIIVVYQELGAWTYAFWRNGQLSGWAVMPDGTSREQALAAAERHARQIRGDG